MVTAAGTFNSVQLAFTHILSHAGAVGPDADPVMGLAGGDPDCVANSFRLLIPNVKAGGLIGRGGCTIKAIREQSGARIEISSQAFHFHPVHGPLPAPSPPGQQSHGAPVGDVGGATAGPRLGGGNGAPSGGNNRFGPAGAGGLGGGGGPGAAGGGGSGGIPLPPPILMDRVMTAMGSFDACLRAHHLVASKLMDVRPSPVPMASGPPPPPISVPSCPPTSSSASSSAATAASATSGPFTGARVNNSVGLQQGGARGPPLSSYVFNFSGEYVRGGGGGGGDGGVAGGASRVAGKAPTASTSPSSSVSEKSSYCHRQPWDFEDRSWAAPVPSSPLLGSDFRGEVVVSERGNGTITPLFVLSASGRDSPRSSTTGSLEDLSSATTDARALPSSRGSSSPSVAGVSSSAVVPDFLARGGGAPVVTLDASFYGAARGGDSSGNGVVGCGGDLGDTVDDGELPACLVGILDSFLGGSSSSTSDAQAPPPRSPSTITGIEVEVGRAAFALLGVRDLDDIKHLSGAGIIAPESPERFFHLSDEVVAAAAAVLSSAVRGNAPADGFGLAATAAAANKANAAAYRPPGSSSSCTVSVSAEGFSSREDINNIAAMSVATDGIRRLDMNNDNRHHHHHHLAMNNSVVSRGGDNENHNRSSLINNEPVFVGRAASSLNTAADDSGSGGEAGGGVGGDGGGAIGPSSLKTVRITGTAEEVQLAEYLIRVRTAGRDMAAA